MMATYNNDIPCWEDFAAFSDLVEIDHVMDVLTAWCEAYPDANDPVDYKIGEKSRLIERLNLQDREMERAVEREKPGLYRRTWYPGFFDEMVARLYELAEDPSNLKAELPWLKECMYKTLIVAHEIFDPVHRAKLIAEATTEAISERARKAVNARHAAPGGARDMRLEAWKLSGSGTYGNTKDDAAEPISKKLGVAYSTARKYLRGKPPNQAAA